MSEKLPNTIYLQWFDNAPDEITWCEDRINDDDVAYVRRDAWIPVSERLPEIQTVVLVAVKNHSHAQEAILTSRDRWRVWGGEFGFQSVTHWMPLPETPKAREP